MAVSHRLKALWTKDIRTVGRDSLTRWMAFLPLIYALVLRWGAPLLAEYLGPEVELETYFPLIVSYFLVAVTPVLYGMVVGFNLLDERVDLTLIVTPMPLTEYFLYRLTTPVILCTFWTFVLLEIAGLTHASRLETLPSLLLVSLETPITALFLASCAQNKVQGFALMKLCGSFSMLPVAGYFLSYPWQWLAGVCPAYWPAKLFWMAHEQEQGGFWIYFTIGLVVHIVLLVFFMKYFRRKACS